MSGLVVEGLEVARGEFHLGPIRLDVPPASATALLGRSGAGKTTLLRTLAGFLPAQRGEVRLGDRSIGRLPPERRGFGFVPPNLGLFPHRRVRENVAYPLRLRGAPDAAAQTRVWIDRFHLGGLADRYPAELSSGQQQRVAMARALAAGPSALLWDEPLAALDVESRDVLLRLVRDLLVAEGLSLLLVTHDAATALALADRIVVLVEGRIRFDGPPEQLARAPLDRFIARFLGFENLLSLAEIETGSASGLAPDLRRAAGPGGVVIPPTALTWSRSGTNEGPAQVNALRWTPGGWVVVVQEGPWTFRVPAGPHPPTVRVGDPVTLSLDPTLLKPLSDLTDEEAA
ncbi:MAG: ABC transporter ATP-binding protein [Thermoplasmata archaeon]|nr:ABC transporter ATP-binding protein [Thermoplasmata archaeon]